MFPTRHHTHHTSKSRPITVISIIQTFGTAMGSILIPLYLYEVFQSEFIVGQITSVGSLIGIFSLLTLGFVLTKFHRKNVYKVGVLLSIIGILLFLISPERFTSQVARILIAISRTLTPAILALYIRDLTLPQDLTHAMGKHRALTNISWVLGPIVSGAMISWLKVNGAAMRESISLFKIIPEEFFAYAVPFIIVLILYLIALLLFGHLQQTEHPHFQVKDKKAEPHHHHRHYFENFIGHFQSIKRNLSFINISFISLWWVFIFTYLGILLEQQGMHESSIGIIVGLISLPNIILEPFADRFVKKVKGTTNALLLGYVLFFLLVVIAFIVGFEHMYLFAGLIILSQIGVSITEPLEEAQYFEGTPQSEEGKYYGIHRLGGKIMYFVSPVLIGWITLQYGIEQTFQMIPYLFIPVIIFILYLRKRELRTKQKS